MPEIFQYVENKSEIAIRIVSRVCWYLRFLEEKFYINYSSGYPAGYRISEKKWPDIRQAFIWQIQYPVPPYFSMKNLKKRTHPPPKKGFGAEVFCLNPVLDLNLQKDQV